MVDRSAMKCNLCYSTYWQVFVCHLSDCVRSETERRFVTICFQLCCSVRHYGGSSKTGGFRIQCKKVCCRGGFDL